jgi:hypothetical protein
MKKLQMFALGAILTICFYQAKSQEITMPSEPDYRKPKLFADLPQKMNLKLTGLESLFSLAVGAPVDVSLSDNFNFQGTVVSKSDGKDASFASVVIRSTNRQGASFTFTKTASADGSFRYSGRILSLKNSDVFEIVKENDHYVLQKKDLSEMIRE